MNSFGGVWERTEQDRPAQRVLRNSIRPGSLSRLQAGETNCARAVPVGGNDTATDIHIGLPPGRFGIRGRVAMSVPDQTVGAPHGAGP